MNAHTNRPCMHLGVGTDEVLADTSTSLLFTLEDIIGPCVSRAQDRDHDPIRSAVLKAFAIAHLGDALARSRARSEQENSRVDDGSEKCNAEEGRGARNGGGRREKGKTPIRVRPLPPTPSGSFTLPSASLLQSRQQQRKYSQGSLVYEQGFSADEPRSAPPSRQGSQRRALPRLPIGPRPSSSPSSYAASSSAPSTSYAHSGPRLANAGRAGYF
ncbi:hypothetical protein K525DRAFT_272050 [Schizophyllum commune Loenen D]|nr:hypothetical protein K525DRAFT_272050 [Schizophyllum commune Loenen D]